MEYYRVLEEVWEEWDEGAGALEYTWLAEALHLIQGHPANFTINWQSLFVVLNVNP